LATSDYSKMGEGEDEDVAASHELRASRPAKFINIVKKVRGGPIGRRCRFVVYVLREWR